MYFNTEVPVIVWRQKHVLIVLIAPVGIKMSCELVRWRASRRCRYLTLYPVTKKLYVLQGFRKLGMGMEIIVKGVFWSITACGEKGEFHFCH